MTSIADLASRRDELDVSLGEVAAHLADYHSLAESTLSTRLSEWERGETTPTDEDLAALTEALDEIEEEQNFTYPECSNPECSYTPQLDIDYVDGEPYCIVCTYREEGS